MGQRNIETPEEKVEKAKLKIEEIKTLTVRERGKNPNPVRWPGRGKKGELWFRNRLLWLRTIPLEDGISFITTHAEAAVYYEKNKHYSADLLGIYRRGENETRLGVIELKSMKKVGGKRDDVVDALIQGARNAYLHNSLQGRARLKVGWGDAIRSENCPKYFKNAWIRNPFQTKKGEAHLIVLGDNPWMNAQERWRRYVPELIKCIQEELKIDVSIHSLASKGKAPSSPYMLLPVGKWQV